MLSLKAPFDSSVYRDVTNRSYRKVHTPTKAL